MHTAQAGIFAPGTFSHVYLEFDVVDEKHYKGFAAAVAAISEPYMTTGGVNFVIEFQDYAGAGEEKELLNRHRVEKRGTIASISSVPCGVL